MSNRVITDMMEVNKARRIAQLRNAMLTNPKRKDDIMKLLRGAINRNEIMELNPGMVDQFRKPILLHKYLSKVVEGGYIPKNFNQFTQEEKEDISMIGIMIKDLLLKLYDPKLTGKQIKEIKNHLKDLKNYVKLKYKKFYKEILELIKLDRMGRQGIQKRIGDTKQIAEDLRKNAEELKIAHENVKRLNEEKRRLKTEKTNRNLKHIVWNRISDLPQVQPMFEQVFPNIDLSIPKTKSEGKSKRVGTKKVKKTISQVQPMELSSIQPDNIVQETYTPKDIELSPVTTRDTVASEDTELPSISEVLKQQKKRKDIKITRKDLKKIKSFDVDPFTGDLTPSEVIQDVKMEDKTIPEEHKTKHKDESKISHNPSHNIFSDDYHIDRAPDRPDEESVLYRDQFGNGLQKRKGNKKLLKRFNAAVAELKQQRPGITHRQAQKLVSQYYHSN